MPAIGGKGDALDLLLMTSKSECLVGLQIPYEGVGLAQRCQLGNDYATSVGGKSDRAGVRSAGIDSPWLPVLLPSVQLKTLQDIKDQALAIGRKGKMRRDGKPAAQFEGFLAGF